MPNKIKTNPETPIYFWNTGNGAPPVSPAFAAGFNAEGLPDGSGQLSIQYDLGVAPRSALYSWRASVSVTASGQNPNLGAAFEYYISTSDYNLQDGGLGTTQQTITNLDRRRNLAFIGAVSIDQSAPATYINSGLVEIYARYINIVLINRTGARVDTTIGNQLFVLTPVPDEIQ